MTEKSNRAGTAREKDTPLEVRQAASPFGESRWSSLPSRACEIALRGSCSADHCERHLRSNPQQANWRLLLLCGLQWQMGWRVTLRD